MRGVNHARTGMCAVAGTTALVTLAGYGGHLIADPRTSLLVALAAASHFLRPDIDHPKAIASKLLGPLSELESEFWREVSRRYYTATRGPGDPVEPRAHRGLTHSPVGAVLFGVLAAFTLGASQSLCASLAASWGPWLVATPIAPLITDGGAWTVLGHVAGILGGLGSRALGWFLVGAGAWPLVGILFVGYCATLLAGAFAWKNRFRWGVVGLAFGVVCGPALAADWPWVGLAVAAGCYGHSMGDGCTVSGSPLKHPLPVQTPQGVARWSDYGTPELLRFRTGARRETFWVSAFAVGTAALCLYVVVVGPLSPVFSALLG